ncbi:hypothetical protein [Kaarinaea lacus]
MNNEKARPFTLNGQLTLTPIPRLNTAIGSTLEKLTGLQRLDQMYLQLPPAENDIHFLQMTLDLFKIDWHIMNNELTNIPAKGPVIIVANYPFGALEGILMAYILRQYRRDVKIMANYFLRRIPEIRDIFIGVDPFGSKSSTTKNLKPMRQAIKSSWKNNDFAVVNDIEQISEIVAQFERDQKGVPVLLKQYLKLGGTLLGFNVDGDFNNTLDGLIMVDLLKSDPKVLNKYMGSEQTNAYLTFHEISVCKAA